MKKKCKIVMIPTEDKSDIFLIGDWKKLFFRPNLRDNSKFDSDEAYQHLYIISDEIICPGDYYCTISGNEGILQCSCKEEANDLADVWKKIIASTAPDLMFKFNDGSGFYSTPQPSDSFIQKYIEEYNKGNVITEVMVEYEEHISAWVGNEIISELKVSKDNTITIKKVKDSWNREEVEELCSKAYIDGHDEGGSNVSGPTMSNKCSNYEWIKENL